MLAIADKNGEVQASVPGLARIAGVPVDDCRKAIKKFLSPDPDSRTKDDQGRRIEDIDGGWSLLNFQKYREMASKEDTKNAEAARKARWRARKARNVPECPAHVQGPSTVNPHIADADAEAEEERTRPPVPPVEGASDFSKGKNGRPGRMPQNEAECLLIADRIGFPPEAAKAWYRDSQEARWERGDGSPFDNWVKQMTYERDRQRRVGPEGKTDVKGLDGADKVIHGQELERVGKAIAGILNGYEAHQTMSDKDKVRIAKLRRRRKELQELLGVEV